MSTMRTVNTLTRLATALLLSFVALHPSLVAQGPTPVPGAAERGKIHSRRLDNGLQVLVVQSDAIPFATVEMVFRAGAFTQLTPQEQGVPHLIEHLMFRQGDQGAQGTFEGRAGAIDAFWNGVTSEESVRYYLTFPAKNLEKGIDLISDLVRNAVFNPAALELERKVVTGELLRVAAEPEGLLQTVADRALWGDAGWARKNAGGNIIALNGTVPAQLKQLHGRYYVPNNAALIVTGDVNEATVFELAEKQFKSWKRGPDPLADVPPVVIPPLPGIKREFLNASVRDVTILVRWHGPSVRSDRAGTYAADVFAGLVNHSLSGTRRRLVDGGHFQSVSFSYDTKNYVGPIELQAITTPEKAVAATAALGAELSRLVAPGYSDAADLELAKIRQRVFAEFSAESVSDFAHSLAEMWSSADLEYQVGYADSLQARTSEDVQRFVQTYLKGKPMSVTVLLSTVSQQSVGVAMRNALNAWKVP